MMSPSELSHEASVRLGHAFFAKETIFEEHFADDTTEPNAGGITRRVSLTGGRESDLITSTGQVKNIHGPRAENSWRERV